MVISVSSDRQSDRGSFHHGVHQSHTEEDQDRRTNVRDVRMIVVVAHLNVVVLFQQRIDDEGVDSHVSIHD